MINGTIEKIRHWIDAKPGRMEQARTWFPFWVGFFAILIGYSLQPGGIFFPSEDVTWTTMQERGQWRIGVDPSFPPFEYLDDNGQPVGFDLALATLIADEWDLEVEVIPMGFDSLVDAVQSGQIDSVVSALPYDPRLTKDVRYSMPYFDAGVLIAVLQDSPLIKAAEVDLLSAEDAPTFLSGLRVGVEWGGMGDMIGRRYQRMGSDVELVPLSTPQEVISALQNDPTIDAVLIDNVTLHQAQSSAAIVGIGPILEPNPYVIAAPFEATLLVEALNESLASLQANGQLERLTLAWFHIE